MIKSLDSNNFKIKMSFNKVKTLKDLPENCLQNGVKVFFLIHFFFENI